MHLHRGRSSGPQRFWGYLQIVKGKAIWVVVAFNKMVQLMIKTAKSWFFLENLYQEPNQNYDSKNLRSLNMACSWLARNLKSKRMKWRIWLELPSQTSCSLDQCMETELYWILDTLISPTRLSLVLFLLENKNMDVHYHLLGILSCN